MYNVCINMYIDIVQYMYVHVQCIFIRPRYIEKKHPIVRACTMYVLICIYYIHINTYIVHAHTCTIQYV